MTKKGLFLPLFLILLGCFFAPKANAISLVQVSDTITTSRPSAAAPLGADQAASAGQAIITDNGSFFIASDSATLWNDTGEIGDTVNIASMSATGVPAANQRTVYFTNTAADAHHAGDVITTAITATHVIKFTTASTIPVNGTIVITFPGAGDNSASPSATTFAFNNLQDANISASFSSGTSTCAFTHAAPTITCTVATAPISGGTTVTITIGASTPALINPTKTAAEGTADLWKINIQTADASANGLDSGRTTIGTIESVQVQATVDPTLTFTIAAVSGAINTGNTTGCTNGTDTVNTGIPATATSINLGLLNTASINVSAQLITISTNASGGYALTATSSGHLINPANGVWIPDSTTPAAITVNHPWFGIHPCGLNANTGLFGSGAMGTALYGWPTTTAPLTLASAASGPIGNTVATGGVGAGLTSIEYAGAVDVSVPAGVYTSVITYTATPTF